MPQPSPLPIVVLISGAGSNLQSIIDAIAAGALNARIEAVISNNAKANGLQRAQAAGIATQVLTHTEFESRQAYDKALQSLIDRYNPQLLVLAGFMRILSDDFVNHYHARMINIHPSLLPEFRGLNTHRRALEAGATLHGATVHYVTPELDGGPAIIQARVNVMPDDTPDSLAERVLEQEHQILPLAIQWIATGRVKMKNSAVAFDDQILQSPVNYTSEQ